MIILLIMVNLLANYDDSANHDYSAEYDDSANHDDLYYAKLLTLI